MRWMSGESVLVLVSGQQQHAQFRYPHQDVNLSLPLRHSAPPSLQFLGR